MKIEIKPNDQTWVGKKVRQSVIDKWFEIKFVGKTCMFVKSQDGTETTLNIRGTWELYKEES